MPLTTLATPAELTGRQTSILVGILADVASLASLPIPSGYGTCKRRLAITDAQNGCVRSNPSSWLGRDLDTSDYVMLGRDYRKLETLGLIERHRLGIDGSQQNYTHVSLTDAGRQIAKQLLTSANTATI